MSIDFDALEEGSGKDFLSTLKEIPESLSKNTAKQFFDISINVLNNDSVESDNKSRLLIALCKAISEENYLKVFVSGKYLSQLPYEINDLQAQLFDVLYIVASSSPLSLTSDVARKMEIILPASPRRALGVLIVYGKNFNAVSKGNWQPVLDLLTRPETSDIFKSRLYVKDYVSFLCLLCEKQQYRKERLNETWDAICSCLVVNRDESVCLCYYALTRLCDKGYVNNQGECKLPSVAVACHLRRRQCQKAALSLLMRLKPNADDDNISDVMSSLVWASHTELNANLLLVEFAKEEPFARALVRDASWMTQELPTKVDTMRLFAVVLSHDSLIEDLSQKNEAIAFIRSSIELNTPGVLSAVTTFTRRFNVDQEFAQFCSDYGLLSTYFQYSFEHKDNVSVSATLLFIHTFASVAYSHDLLQACDYVSDLVTNSDEYTSLHAARVACDLAQYPKCAARFQDLQLDDYFVDNQNNPKVKKAGIHFMRALNKARKIEQRDANRPKESKNKVVTSRTFRPDPSDKNQSASQISRELKSPQKNDRRQERRRQKPEPKPEARKNRHDEIEELESNSGNGQPKWVLDEDDSGNHKSIQDIEPTNPFAEEEEEASLLNQSFEDSSTQFIIPQNKNQPSDIDDFDNDDDDTNPFPPSRSSKPYNKPPSPRRSRE